MVEALAPPAIAAVRFVAAAVAFVMLTHATPLELKLASERLYAAPAAEVTATLLTYAISPVPDGVKVTASPGAKIAALPAASRS